MRFQLQRCFSAGLLTVFLVIAGPLCRAQTAQSEEPLAHVRALDTGSTTDAANTSKADRKEAPAATGTAAVNNSNYKIGVGDVLHITVFEEPQFTEVAIVRPDGKISLPLISEIPVAGLTPESVEGTLTTHLQKYVHKPRVTVTVQDIRSRMVYVTGEVQRPGAYPLVDAMNVVQLIARSGGPTDFAKKNKVYVLRADKSAKINVDYRKVLKGQVPEQNVSLTPGDTVVVP